MKPFHLSPEPTRSRRHFGGKKAHAAGRNFQEAIKASALFHHAIVKIEELPQQGARRVWGKDRAQILIPLKIPTDFVGAFKPSGRALFFDAKSTEDASFDVKGLVKAHQLSFLQRMSSAGAIAGLLVEAKAKGRYLWIDADDVTSDRIQFAYNGAIAREWVDLGDVFQLVDFAALWRAYQPQI